MDWASGLPASKEVVRESVDLATVVYEELGVIFNDEGQGHCPFHDDTRPSFGIFESDDGVERAGCWACGWRGDVFDIIQESQNCSFHQAILAAQRYIGHSGPRRAKKSKTIRDFSTELAQSVARYQTDPSPVINFILGKGYPWQAEWLASEWRVGVASDVGVGGVFIPHFDNSSRCTGYKYRTAWTPPMSAGGSRFPALYGIWRDVGGQTVVITEGESDTWSVSWYVPEVVALGLPTGAATALKAEWLTHLQNRDVIICFDGDEVGRSASARWNQALGHNSRVIELPEGVDCVGMGSQIRSALLVG